ncbi:hypothetical protein F511_38974 [Dorcoceras hygrometricum]|uniref:Uncharacterized protein n=1 Tax=Dorcoceras hygrometricum TaxID=472368 RepID=A0A2Z7BIR0_9LAMI|nr:hypothetical protein F511_38974 [Dorcoceras hygrometricum]
MGYSDARYFSQLDFSRQAIQTRATVNQSLGNSDASYNAGYSEEISDAGYIDSDKRKKMLVLEAEDEIVDDQPAAEAATGMLEPVIENEQAVDQPAVGTVLVEPVVEKSPVVEPAVEIPEADTAVDRISLPVVQPVFRFTPRQPTVFALRLSQFCTVFIRYILFSCLTTEDIRSFVGFIASKRTVLSNVQLAVSPVFALEDKQMDIDHRTDSPIHFTSDDTPLDATNANQSSLPAAATPDVTEALAQLQASIDQIRDRDGDAKLKDILLMNLHGIEQRLTARLDDEDRVLGALRKDSHSQKQLLSLDIKSSHKQLSTQVAAAAMDTVDVRRVVKELEAKVIYLDEQVSATRNDLLYRDSGIAGGGVQPASTTTKRSKQRQWHCKWWW